MTNESWDNGDHIEHSPNDLLFFNDKQFKHKSDKEECLANFLNDHESSLPILIGCGSMADNHNNKDDHQD